MIMSWCYYKSSNFPSKNGKFIVICLTKIWWKKVWPPYSLDWRLWKVFQNKRLWVQIKLIPIKYFSIGCCRFGPAKRCWAPHFLVEITQTLGFFWQPWKRAHACWIFWPAFGCCARQTLVKIVPKITLQNKHRPY